MQQPRTCGDDPSPKRRAILKLRPMEYESKMSLPKRANYSLTESALSPFPAEPAQNLNTKGAAVLTKQEKGVVRLVAEGLKNREIARQLNLSENTVRNYMFRIFDKLGTSNRVELELYAVRQQI
jgi:DNA-binding NarL/FixJ family response regulator